MKPLAQYSGALAILVCGLWLSWSSWDKTPAPGFALPQPQENPAAAPLLRSALINSGDPPRVHAASITELADGRLCAAWFAGLREGGTEVAIHWACKDATATAWGAQQRLATAAQTTRDTGLWTRKLGNPLLLHTPRGELWLIYVSVTLGGWSTSQLNLMRSTDQGASWQAARRLWLSPFFNISTLVKAPPVFFDNGDIGVPVYHELAGIFPQLLLLSPEGRVKGLRRMGLGRHSLQPVVLPENGHQAIALMRDASRNPPRAWRSQTQDGGQHWQRLGQTGLANPDSAIAALRLADGRILAVANDSDKGRRRLSLLISQDRGQNWRPIYRFEDKEAQPQPDRQQVQEALNLDIKTLGPGPDAARIQANSERNLCRQQNRCDWQYDYPFLIQDRQGDLHLVYTWSRSFIRHIHFNLAWVDSLL